MLTELAIRDFAIINKLDLSFGPGLLVLTGETGVGKSIMVDAVELLIGGRADSAVVRSGADKAFLEATFRLDPVIREFVQGILEREQLLDDGDDGEVHLSREIRLEGRNVCRVNGRIVTLSLLRELGDSLVDVHGQSEHLSLLRVQHHRRLLDRYLGAEETLAAYRSHYRSLMEVREELADLRERDREAAQRADFLSFQIEEIESAQLRPGEDEELKSEQARLANAEKLSILTEAATAALDEGLRGEIAASDLLGQAVESVEELAGVDNSMDGIHIEAQALLEQVTDLARRLRVYREGIEYNPTRLDEVEERLSLVQNLQRKYGGSIDEVLAYAEEARAELETITHAEQRVEELQLEEEELLSVLAAHGVELSRTRRVAADSLAEAVALELQDLNMAGAEFGVDLRWQDDPQGVPVEERRVTFGPHGLDQIEFLVAPNPGEGLKPLVKIASGGETSRLMLGMKGVLAEADEIPTLIFDEIDQGIGGRVGAVVGRKLRALTAGHQVLCITHLPQLAAYGARHYKVDKQVRGGRTETIVRELAEADRVQELASMLGGDSAPNLESAQALLAEASRQESAVEAG